MKNFSMILYHIYGDAEKVEKVLNAKSKQEFIDGNTEIANQVMPDDKEDYEQYIRIICNTSSDEDFKFLLSVAKFHYTYRSSLD